MKIINRERGTGKTSIILSTAHATGTPIVTLSLTRKSVLEQKAREAGFSDVKVFEMNQFIDENKKDTYDEILIDDAEQIIEEVFKRYLGVGIVSMTISVPMDVTA